MDTNESLLKFEEYLKRRFPDRRTPQDYLSDIRQFIAFQNKAWREVIMQDIDAFVDDQRKKGLKATTINRRVAALKTFFDFLAEETGDLAWPNPVRFKRHASKRPRRLPRDLSNAAVEQLWNVIEDRRDRAWFALMLRAGLRVGEVTSLCRKDILVPSQMGQPAQLRVEGKGRKERMVLLSSDAYAVLQEWLEIRPQSEHEQVFLNDRIRPFSTSGIEWLLNNYGEKADVSVTPHQLRHTYARQLTEAQMPIVSLSKLMGHAQVTTTQIYTAGADPELNRAYQEAMQRVKSDLSMPKSDPIPSSSPSLPVQEDLVHVEPAKPAPLPDWTVWAEALPAEIRQVCLDYVQKLALTWKPNSRRFRSLSVLSELKRFWDWQLARRPISHPGQLSLRDLQAYQTDFKAIKKETTINRNLDYVMGILHQLDDQGYPIDVSVFRLHVLPRPESLPRYLSDPEILQLESTLTSWLTCTEPMRLLETACLFVLLHTGIRSGECADLLVQDLDLESRKLSIRQGKGLRDRVVYLSDSACLALKNYLQAKRLDPTSPLWVLPNGKLVPQVWIRKRTKEIGRLVGIPDLYPHRLRHTFATRLLNAGMDITRIQKLLGHDRLATTMIYARIHDATVENDYRNAMSKIELRQMPLSNTPIPVSALFDPNYVKVQNGA